MNLKELILNKLDNSWTLLEKARFIYIELGKILEFNPNTISNTNKEIFDEILNKDYDIENITDIKVTCSNWALIYKKLLDEIGIISKIETNEFCHSWVVIEEDDKKVFADATSGFCTDLARCKMNRIPYNFYFIDENKRKIDFDFTEIDKKIGYFKKRLESKKALLKLKRRMRYQSNIFEKAEAIFNSLNFSKFGFFEGNELIKYINKNCLSNQELSNIKATTLSKTTSYGEVDSIKCITIKSNNLIKYYIYSPKKGVFQIEKSDLDKIFKMGYGIEDDKVILGIDTITHFEIFKDTSEYNTKLKRENLYTRKYNSSFPFLK